MGRRHAAKGKKKRKLEDGAASRADDAAELPPPEHDKGKGEEDVTEEDETVEVAEGIPVLPWTVDGRKRPRAIFVLERACLEVGKVGKDVMLEMLKFMMHLCKNVTWAWWRDLMWSRSPSSSQIRVRRRQVGGGARRPRQVVWPHEPDLFYRRADQF